MSNSWNQIEQIISSPITFCKILGVLKLPNWSWSGQNFARFEEFVLIA